MNKNYYKSYIRLLHLLQKKDVGKLFNYIFHFVRSFMYQRKRESPQHLMNCVFFLLQCTYRIFNYTYLTQIRSHSSTHSIIVTPLLSCDHCTPRVVHTRKTSLAWQTPSATGMKSRIVCLSRSPNDNASVTWRHNGNTTIVRVIDWTSSRETEVSMLMLQQRGTTADRLFAST